MEFDPSKQQFIPDEFDRTRLGIHQPVAIHDVWQMRALVGKNLQAVEDDGMNPPSRPTGIRAADNLGLLCLHSDPSVLLQRVRENFEFRR